MAGPPPPPNLKMSRPLEKITFFAAFLKGDCMRKSKPKVDTALGLGAASI